MTKTINIRFSVIILFYYLLFLSSIRGIHWVTLVTFVRKCGILTPNALVGNTLDRPKWDDQATSYSHANVHLWKILINSK